MAEDTGKDRSSDFLPSRYVLLLIFLLINKVRVVMPKLNARPPLNDRPNPNPDTQQNKIYRRGIEVNPAKNIKELHIQINETLLRVSTLKERFEALVARAKHRFVSISAEINALLDNQMIQTFRDLGSLRGDLTILLNDSSENSTPPIEGFNPIEVWNARYISYIRKFEVLDVEYDSWQIIIKRNEYLNIPRYDDRLFKIKMNRIGFDNTNPLAEGLQLRLQHLREIVPQLELGNDLQFTQDMMNSFIIGLSVLIIDSNSQSGIQFNNMRKLLGGFHTRGGWLDNSVEARISDLIKPLMTYVLDKNNLGKEILNYTPAKAIVSLFLVFARWDEKVDGELPMFVTFDMVKQMMQAMPQLYTGQAQPPKPIPTSVWGRASNDPVLATPAFTNAPIPAPTAAIDEQNMDDTVDALLHTLTQTVHPAPTTLPQSTFNTSNTEPVVVASLHNWRNENDLDAIKQSQNQTTTPATNLNPSNRDALVSEEIQLTYLLEGAKIHLKEALNVLDEFLVSGNTDESRLQELKANVAKGMEIVHQIETTLNNTRIQLAYNETGKDPEVRVLEIAAGAAAGTTIGVYTAKALRIGTVLLDVEQLALYPGDAISFVATTTTLSQTPTGIAATTGLLGAGVGASTAVVATAGSSTENQPVTNTTPPTPTENQPVTNTTPPTPTENQPVTNTTPPASTENQPVTNTTPPGQTQQGISNETRDALIGAGSAAILGGVAAGAAAYGQAPLYGGVAGAFVPGTVQLATGFTPGAKIGGAALAGAALGGGSTVAIEQIIESTKGNTNPPARTENQPVTNTNPPAPTENQPVTNTNPPAPTENQPVANTNAPVSTNNLISADRNKLVEVEKNISSQLEMAKLRVQETLENFDATETTDDTVKQKLEDDIKTAFDFVKTLQIELNNTRTQLGIKKTTDIEIHQLETSVNTIVYNKNPIPTNSQNQSKSYTRAQIEDALNMAFENLKKARQYNVDVARAKGTLNEALIVASEDYANVAIKEAIFNEALIVATSLYPDINTVFVDDTLAREAKDIAIDLDFKQGVKAFFDQVAMSILGNEKIDWHDGSSFVLGYNYGAGKERSVRRIISEMEDARFRQLSGQRASLDRLVDEDERLKAIRARELSSSGDGGGGGGSGGGGGIAMLGLVAIAAMVLLDK
jgi:hypothetical protein